MTKPRIRRDVVGLVLAAAIVGTIIITVLVIVRAHTVRHLYNAAADGKLERVKWMLIVHPAAANRRSKRGYMPIHFAAIAGHAEVAKALLAKGALVDAVDKHGRTALHFTAYSCQKEVARLLLDRGADVNARTQIKGWTPLHWAASYGYRDFVELLLANGADANATNKDGKRPYDLAAEKGHEAAAEALKNHADGKSR